MICLRQIFLPALRKAAPNKIKAMFAKYILRYDTSVWLVRDGEAPRIR